MQPLDVIATVCAVKVAGIVLVAAVVLAGCGGDGSASSAEDAAKTAKSYVPPKTAATLSSTSTSTTTTPKQRGDAVAIAKRLGCVNPKADPPGQATTIAGLPNARESVDCVAAGTQFNINVYASHADLEKVFSPGAVVIECQLLKGFGLDGPVYSVNGYDFEVEAADPPPDNGIGPMGTLEQARALSDALDLPVTTTNCP